MQYCKECGNQIDNDAEFCPTCGAAIRESKINYVKTSTVGDNTRTILALLVGGFIILIALPIMFGGFTVLTVDQFLDQGDGYIGIGGIDFATDTQVLVFKDLEIEDIMLEDVESQWVRRWILSQDGLGSTRITIESTNGKEIFMGIARVQDIQPYLVGAEYDELQDIDIDHPRDEHPDLDYRHNYGNPITTDISDLDIWVASVSGDGEEVLQWTPRAGNYWVVVMNEDLTDSVEFDGGLGIKLGILKPIGGGLLSAGFVMLLVGIVIIYFGAIKRS